VQVRGRGELAFPRLFVTHHPSLITHHFPFPLTFVLTLLLFFFFGKNFGLDNT